MFGLFNPSKAVQTLYRLINLHCKLNLRYYYRYTASNQNYWRTLIAYKVYEQ